jgi:hypothetical protein
MAKRVREGSGAEPIDPAKVARVFLDLADNPQPPRICCSAATRLT